MWVLGLRPGHMQERSVLSTSESSLHPLLFILRFLILTRILCISSQVLHFCLFLSSLEMGIMGMERKDLPGDTSRSLLLLA